MIECLENFEHVLRISYELKHRLLDIAITLCLSQNLGGIHL